MTDDIFGRLGRLSRGWDGYEAEPPGEWAIDGARRLVELSSIYHFPASRVAPSAVGGVGVTFRAYGRMVYAEFLNSRSVLCLFSDGETEPASRRFSEDREGLGAILSAANEYLIMGCFLE